MKKTVLIPLISILSFGFSGCDILIQEMRGDTDTQHMSSFEPITGKFVLYDNMDKRFEYHDTYFDINGSKGNFHLKYYENGVLKRDCNINKIVTNPEYNGQWKDNLHFNIQNGNDAEHIRSYTESLEVINQFRILDEYHKSDQRYFLSELPYVIGTYVREGKEYKEEAYHTNEFDPQTPSLSNVTAALPGTYKLDDDHDFYFVNPRGFTAGTAMFDCYYQYFSSELEKPLEGFAFATTNDKGRSSISFHMVRDVVDWGKDSENRLVFGYYTFDEEDKMHDHFGSESYQDGVVYSFTFEHLSRNWTEKEWDKFLKEIDYHLPDAIIYEYVGGTYVKV